MVTAVTAPAEQNKTDEAPEETNMVALVAAVKAVLGERKVDEVLAGKVLAAVQSTVAEEASRQTVSGFWRGIAQRHGLRAMERAAGISRFHCLLAIAGLQGNAMVWVTLGHNMHRGRALDEAAAEKLAKGSPRP